MVMPILISALAGAHAIAIVTEWDGVGSYRRALSRAEVKASAIPFLSYAIDEPSAYEVVHARTPDSVGFGRLVGTDAGCVWPGIAALTSAVFSMNLLLATLNLIPLPPLDGSGAILLFMNENLANRYQEILWTSPSLGMIGMLAAWQLVDRVFTPVFWAAVHITYPGAGYG